MTEMSASATPAELASPLASWGPSCLLPICVLACACYLWCWDVRRTDAVSVTREFGLARIQIFIFLQYLCCHGKSNQLILASAVPQDKLSGTRDGRNIVLPLGRPSRAGLRRGLDST
jgi:hypothetical protein